MVESVRWSGMRAEDACQQGSTAPTYRRQTAADPNGPRLDFLSQMDGLAMKAAAQVPRASLSR